ncbi:membrane metallo-endopeptidase-like 1 isoform X1 [Frankliniella occidentalis]|uniref:Membrane metallo-endopeptidase-like 1 isoform X1 n=1 Tax=Frankliniella occidentalis TaxID=133901 RepID=A0A6J1SJ47_FRAOC|nr:membrane metallo-endopeptidase-like 1 isoform X1 [Frankliniella occidentalis]
MRARTHSDGGRLPSRPNGPGALTMAAPLRRQLVSVVCVLVALTCLTEGRNIFNYDVALLRAFAGGGGNYLENGAILESYEVCESRACRVAARSLLESLNMSADPCTDFYEFACGGWISKHPVPATESHFNHFNEAEDRLQRQLKGILEVDANPGEPVPVRQAKKLYETCLNSEAVEADGLSPLLEELAALGGWPMAMQAEAWDEASFSWQAAVTRLLAQWSIAPLFVMYVFTDKMDSSRNVITLDQPALTLARRMLLEPASYRPQHAAMLAWMSGAATEVGRAAGVRLDPARVTEQAQQVVLFETELARITTPAEGRRDGFRTYNPRTLAELQAWTGAVRPVRPDSEVRWLDVLRGMMAGTGVLVDPSERIVVRELDFVQKLVSLVDQTPRRVLANYIWWRLVRALSGDLTDAMRQLAFQFDRTLIGTLEDSPRWKDCVQRASSLLGFAVGYEYVARHFDDAAKLSAVALVRDLRASFAADMAAVDWMDSDTRDAALHKAEAMTEFIGYPDWYANASALEQHYRGVTVGGGHFRNMKAVRGYLVRQSLVKLRRPVDRAEWLTGPAVVNAYYNPGANSIIFPAGILQPPFFSRGRVEALNYGSVGVVIGHEITHGFDDMGRQSDAQGNLAQWWSAATLETYLRKAQCIVQQYDSYRVPELDNVLGTAATVNGVTTQGENIADSGGLRLAYKAYQRYLQRAGPEPRLVGLEEFTPEQLFFLGFATMWCESSTKESLLHEVLTDPHAPHRFRVQGSLANSRDFSLAWGCPTGPNRAGGGGGGAQCHIW